MVRTTYFIRLARHFVTAIVLVAGSSIAWGQDRGAREPGSARKPNVVVFVADDLGYADLGIQGCKDVPTPQIDSLGRNGIRFTNGYVSCPVCSPTRAGFMTGRYQQRFGHEINPGPPGQADAKFGLPLTEVTIADRMKSLGYVTGMFGKWHLGFSPEFQPQKRGFDEFFGFLAGAHSYDGAGRERDPLNPIMRGTQPVEEREYTTVAFGREAVSFIEKHAKNPFFLYLPFNAVHAPLQGLDKYQSRFSSIPDEKRRTYAAMLTAMDDAVGGVLDALRDKKLEENTLIFFFSDNGGPTVQTTSRNDPLRGFKSQVLEGGIRIPFLIQWKGHLPAGTVYDKPVISLDIHPTAVAAAGGTIPADARLDGVNLLPYLTGDKKEAPHDRLFWRYGAQWAIRMGDWKLLGTGKEAPQLYNLAKDIAEKTELMTKHPEKAKELQAAYDAWNAQLVKPKWSRGRGGQPDAPAGPGKAGRRARGRANRAAGGQTQQAQ